MLSCSRPDIHNAVCSTHGILIMFYNDQTVSQITKLHQRTEKPVIVSLMKSDTGLIQNIGNTYQTGADLCCQSDTLCFSTGQTSGCTGKCQIVQSNIHEESHSGTDFF